MPSGGRDFLRLMNDQSRRAADFDRRMRWSWMRKDLTDDHAADASAGGSGGGAAGVAEAVIDLRPIEERTEPPRAD